MQPLPSTWRPLAFLPVTLSLGSLLKMYISNLGGHPLYYLVIFFLTNISGTVFFPRIYLQYTCTQISLYP